MIGTTSVVSAWAGEPGVWTGRLILGSSAWNGATGALWLAVAWRCLRPSTAALRWPIALALGVFGLATLRDAWVYFDLLVEGSIQSRAGIPMSLGLLVLTLGLAALTLRPRPPRPRGERPHGWRRIPVHAVAIGAGALLVCLALLTAFGATDYRRPADCAIVLGARVYADGRPSSALADRVATGIELYREGAVPFLVMSGGIDPTTGLSEAAVMGQMAERAGVPAERIVLDEAGVNTRASSIHCARILRERGWDSGLLVSHGYHLLRAKAAFDRQGAAVFTVPAKQERPLRKAPYFLLRECAAWMVFSLPSRNDAR